MREVIGRPHNPLDYITKVTAVHPRGECPLWHKWRR
jgi:hypothetical protein